MVYRRVHGYITSINLKFQVNAFHCLQVMLLTKIHNRIKGVEITQNETM